MTSNLKPAVSNDSLVPSLWVWDRSENDAMSIAESTGSTSPSASWYSGRPLSPGAVKMQTTVAIRDENPHRFKILPLRQVRQSGLELPVSEVFDMYTTPKGARLAHHQHTRRKTAGHTPSMGSQRGDLDSLVFSVSDQGSIHFKSRRSSTQDTEYQQSEVSESQSQTSFRDRKVSLTMYKSLGLGYDQDVFASTPRRLERSSASHDTLVTLLSDHLESASSWGTVSGRRSERTDSPSSRDDSKDTPRLRRRSATVSSARSSLRRESYEAFAFRDSINILGRQQHTSKRQAIYATGGLNIQLLGDASSDGGLYSELSFHGAPDLRLPAGPDEDEDEDTTYEIPEGEYIIDEGIYVYHQQRLLPRVGPLCWEKHHRDSVDAVVCAGLAAATLGGHYGQTDASDVMRELLELLDAEIVWWTTSGSAIRHTSLSVPVPF